MFGWNNLSGATYLSHIYNFKYNQEPDKIDLNLLLHEQAFLSALFPGKTSLSRMVDPYQNLGYPLLSSIAN